MLNPITLSKITQTFQQNPIKNPITLKRVNLMQTPDVFQKSMPKVSFTGHDEDAIRDLGNIGCPCCGDKMLTNKDFSKIRNGIRQSDGSSKTGIEVLTPYEEYMHDTEKKCFNILKAESEKNPTMNFQQILNKNREKNLVGLKEKENKILDEIDTIAKVLSEPQQEKIKKTTEETRKILSTNEKDIKFKRKNFIANINDLELAIDDKETFKKIQKAAKKMPSSSNDVNAFMVKYAERNHGEIAERLVKLSVGTIEHIHPQSEGGRNKIENYLLECGECNHNRSSIPLDQWITEEHPEMVENTKKYIEEVERLIESGENEDLEGYPESVARTLLFESNGLIDVYGYQNKEDDNNKETVNENKNENKKGFGALTAK